jgi:RES domain-containing protein
VAYLGEDIQTCLAEVYQVTRFVDVDYEDPYLTGFETAGDFRVADLTGRWLIKAGASAAAAWNEKARTRARAGAIHESWPDLDGIIAPSALVGGSRVVVLWTDEAMPAAPSFSAPLDSPALAQDISRAAAGIGYRSNVILWLFASGIPAAWTESPLGSMLADRQRPLRKA